MNGPDYRYDIERTNPIGAAGEVWVTQLKHGTIEVKVDQRAAETGNLFIEISCRTRTGWGPSGLSVTQADTWAFVIGGSDETIGRRALLIPTTDLKSLVENLSLVEMGNGNNPTTGKLLPISAALGMGRIRPVPTPTTSQAATIRAFRPKPAKFKASSIDDWLAERER